MATSTINPVAKTYDVDVTYASKTLHWHVTEFQNGTIIAYVDAGDVEVAATTAGSGGYYSDVQNIPLPVNMASGNPIGVGAQITFLSNASLSIGNQTVNFRIVSLNSRASVMLPVITVVGKKA